MGTTEKEMYLNNEQLVEVVPYHNLVTRMFNASISVVTSCGLLPAASFFPIDLSVVAMDLYFLLCLAWNNLHLDLMAALI